jgi:anthranilate/para-aminobenzoate synthase component I
MAASHGGPFSIAACWPHQDMPLVLSMVGGRQIVIATSFTPVSFADLASRPIEEWAASSVPISSTTIHSAGLGSAGLGSAGLGPTVDGSPAADLPRWIFVLPYDTYAGHQHEANVPSERPLAWEIRAALVWDELTSEPRYVAREDASTARFHLAVKPQITSLLADAKKWTPPPLQAMALRGGTSDDTYLDSSRKIIESIRRGDFYQVNLLRYFSVDRAHGWDNLCARMEANSGPHGALITAGSRVIASLSPERFIEISPQDGTFKISTWPIKGTSPRFPMDEKKDAASGEALAHSAKDQAELHMIIDLMRNDLTKICGYGTVHANESVKLRKFQHVWHLEGEIAGELTSNQTLGQILTALCPGGSITGAPKIAAMDRIRTEEGQPRGFFMGNVFRINHDGSLQSNILIRTLVSGNWMRSAHYAAGSGLVIKSDPGAELLEIQSKCSPVTSI